MPETFDELPPHDRRRFFSSSLFRLLRPLADYVEKKLPIELPIVRAVLRPPGALSESKFLETCFRCGRCAEACPANAISMMQSTEEALHGTPLVEPVRQACVVCDELACMKVCPSGALVLVDRLEIRMGLAVVEDPLCVRSRGESCTLCIDKCPLGATAIRLDERGRVEVIDPAPTGQGCIGCGVCEQHCPTTPAKAIRVHPS